MSLMFSPASYRASQSDLTINVSPLGLVELADEEFEVHGPRLSRYANYWAWYLGHHWAYRREVGENPLTFNYVRALGDYVTNFTFGKGITFRTPPATASIIPSLLKRVWEQDNSKEKVLWEIGQVGGVCGDVFAKVAYEDPYVDTIGRLHPGKVRIIPLNPAHCFPEWHQHDRSRLIRFKLKYRFWATGPDGTRQVYTYTELITETGIEEYINNEMINARPNPLGVIPIAHAANIPVSGSPWGLSDINDLIPLNREFNEKAVELSDIINYHAAPITVISGARASQLEKGPRKTWTIPKDAKAENLQGLVELEGPMLFLEMVKRGMHEMIGVPEAALGQMQPISNTSGVALHIQYQPLMNRYGMKKLQYSGFFQKINELVILTVVQKEPWSLQFNPGESDRPNDGALLVLDPSDPTTYETSVHWPPPLPVDLLVKLNEIQAKMLLGLESKRGALRDLGEEFPEEKMAEIYAELVEDAKDDGALQMLKATMAAATFAVTGVDMTDTNLADAQQQQGEGVTSAGAEQPLPGPVITPEVQNMASSLVERAYGTKLAQTRNPSND